MQNVYVKSEKALKEFEQGNRLLNLSQRNLLNIVDGKRTCAQLAKFFDSDHVFEMLADLEKLGFLVSENAVQKPSIPNHKPSHLVDKLQNALSKEHVLFIKIFLIEEAKLQLGLLSFAIVQQISMVRNADELKSSIAVWHIAIRESRNGGEVANQLMEKLLHLMATPPQMLASDHAS